MVLGPKEAYTFSTDGNFNTREIDLPYSIYNYGEVAFAEESLYVILKGVPYLFGGVNGSKKVSV